MKDILGALCYFVGVCVAAYVGIYLMFVGGIVQVVDVVRAPELVSEDLAWGVARIIFGGLSAGLCFIPFFLLGQFLRE